MTVHDVALEARRLALIDKIKAGDESDLAQIRAVCGLAAEIAGTPVAYVSIVGDTTQTLIAGIGIGTDGKVARSETICTHLVATGGQLVIPDTEADARSRNCPLVTGKPQMRSYAGTVLEPEPGLRVGALCVADRVQRVFPPETLTRLGVLGETCSALLKAQADRRELTLLAAREQERSAALKTAAEHDDLTGLLNQGAFWRGVATAMARGVFGGLAVLDVDNFKQVNDRHGHPFGDSYLKVIARALETAIPKDALLGRLGGDEFAIYVPLSPEGAGERLTTLLYRLRERLADAVLPLGKSGLGRVSVGAALYPAHGCNYEDLYKRADIAMYAAKSGGRDCHRIYDRALDSAEHFRRLRAEFADALEQGHIEPFFQPVVHLERSKVYGMEALVRWRHPERGLLAPADFPRVFEERDTAMPLTRFVITSAVEQFSRIRRLENGPRRLGLNVTEFDLLDADFVPWIDWLLAEMGASWDNLVFEITENVVLEDDIQACRSVEDLRNSGAMIALDDFGTGHGTLKHLKDWPVDMVKIDKSFIENVDRDPKAASIVSAVVALSRQLGIGVTCEGIETEAQRHLVQEMGCVLGQGYLFSKPLEIEAAVSFVQSSGPEMLKAQNHP